MKEVTKNVNLLSEYSVTLTNLENGTCLTRLRRLTTKKFSVKESKAASQLHSSDSIACTVNSLQNFKTDLSQYYCDTTLPFTLKSSGRSFLYR